MKCKLSKLFFLALIGAISVNGYSQTEAERKEIASGYDLKELNQLAKEYQKGAQLSYERGVMIAKERNLPLEGVTPSGAYFSLRGVDSDTGELIYFQTSNNTPTNSSVQTARSQHLYNGGSLGINIQGLGMNIGIWDGGIPQSNHPNLGVPRVFIKDDGNVGVTQRGIDHATHVAGTMIGNGSSQISARGISFESNIWANTWFEDLTKMTAQAAQGLLVSNHSYGDGNTAHLGNPGIFGRYNQRARNVDKMMFEAEKYQPVYAAGNDGVGIDGDPSRKINVEKDGFDQMINENVAKNTVTVAAIAGMTNYASVTAVTRADFSQSGPTDDYRIKPDISAKGLAVYSSAMPSPESVNSYDTKQGTSMAAPAVTAVFALWQQYSRQLWPVGIGSGSRFFRSASLRALMAHTAKSALTVGPNARTGWGIINAEGGAIVMKDASEGKAVFKELQLINGQSYFLDVELDGSKPLVATIAWTDKQGNVVNSIDSSVPVLVNDLDLRVERPGGVVLMPWSLSKVYVNPIAVTNVDNNVDNIEKIDFQINALNAAPAGVYRIKVSHKGNLDEGKQKFSLIVSGGVVSFEEPDDVGLAKNKIESLRIYPNPATDLLNISADAPAISNAVITMYDVLGKKVYQNETLFDFGSDASIDVSVLKPGVYLIEVLKDNNKDTRKIIIK